MTFFVLIQVHSCDVTWKDIQIIKTDSLIMQPRFCLLVNSVIVTIKMKHPKATCTAELYFHTALFSLLHHVLQTQRTGDIPPQCHFFVFLHN